MTALNVVVVLAVVLCALLVAVLLVTRRGDKGRRAPGDAPRAPAPRPRPGAPALQPSPQDAGAMAAHALRCLEQGNLDGAHTSLQALLLLGDTGPMSKVEAFLHLAEVYARRGERPKARNMVDKALELDPDLAAAQRMAARLEADR